MVVAWRWVIEVEFTRHDASLFFANKPIMYKRILSMTSSLRVFRVCSFVLWMLVAGCGKHEPPYVVVYTAQDQEFAEPIFDNFTRDTGIIVKTKPDAESTKTVGLTEAIIHV